MLRETSRGLFALSPPPILNRVKNELTDSRPVKTIKKEKDRFHCFIASRAEVIRIVTVIILEDMFGDIKISCFYRRGNRGGEIVLLSLLVCKCSTSASVRYKILIIRKSPSNKKLFVE